MKVIAAINGTITAESVAFYALMYAQAQKFTLVLLHIKNEKDNLDDVQASIERISTVALSKDVQIESVILQKFSKTIIKNFILSEYIDTIFCSTRKHTKFITDSFSELLINMNFNIDIAVIRIVNISNIMEVDNMFLSIKEDKLSVKKFAFFATLASAYEAKAEIYSVTDMSIYKLARLKMHEIKERLFTINYNLRHYIKLANFMPFTLYIKHDFTSNETQSILMEIAKSDVQLLVIGAKRLSVSSFFFKEMPIEKLMRDTSVNTIAYYTKE